MKKCIALIIAMFFLSGCASSTIIKSNPPGAKMYLDGQFKCETPCTHKDTAPMGTTRTVTLKKEGYKDTTGQIRREELSTGALIGGIFFFIPLIWVLEYPPEYTYDMEKD